MLPRGLSLVDAALVALLLAGVGVRVLPGLFTSFPMGDGGLFAVMAADIQAAGYALPHFTSYNGGEIPFAYPPLGLYVLAGLSDLFGVSPITVMDLWAPLLAVLSMGSAWLLLAELTDRRTAAWAVALFALTPRSFEWLIVGGGVTRTLGFNFALLALWQLAVALRPGAPPRGAAAHALAAGVLAGLCIVTHPEATAFGVISVLAFGVREWGRLGRYAGVVALAALPATAMAMPWLLINLERHGLGPFLDALTSHNNRNVALEHFFGFDTGAMIPVDPIKVAGMLGLVLLLLRRSWFVPAWYGALMLLITGAGPTYAMLPGALAAMEGIRWLAARVAASWVRPLAAAGAGVAVLLAALAPLQPLSPTRQVSEDARQVMAWVRTHTSPDARFAVVSGTFWWADTEAEWFPALTGRISVATAQGAEWLGEERWNEALQSHERLQGCANAGVRCLAGWAGEFDIEVDYVWRRGDATLPLQDALLRTDEGLVAAWDAQQRLDASEQACASDGRAGVPPGPRGFEACRRDQRLSTL
ncbi:MAG TPA: hypothetical protein VFH63_04325 [candidate division Zixibacteria bacterium]|nr:hypothetical protein [candidate division Zixibacteria bacterium]